MNFPYGLLPYTWHWAAALIFVAILAPVVYRAPWSRLKDEKQLHVYLGTCVALLLLWTIRARTMPGLEYHYLGATLLTLLFGWRLAIVAISVVLAGSVISGASDWQSFPMNALTMGMVPVTASYLIYRTVDRRLPNNFFIYIFLCAFFGAGAAVTTATITACLLLLWSGAYSFEQLANQYFPLAPLLAFPEAFITGMLMTLIVVYRPDSVGTFDDERYIRNK